MTGKPESTRGKGKKAARKAKLNKETLRDLSPKERGEGVQGGARMTDTYAQQTCSCNCF